jgi:hypothetical protein
LLEEANAKITMLETAKDPVEVRGIKKAFAGAEGLQQEFDALIEAVSDARPIHASNIVFKHILMDHFGKAPSINWLDDKRDFDQAIQYSLVDANEPYDVEWNKSKLIKLRKAIEAVERFLSSEDGQRVIELQDEGIPDDPADREFWEYHLSI